jgi:hypothetical protein
MNSLCATGVEKPEAVGMIDPRLAVRGMRQILTTGKAMWGNKMSGKAMWGNTNIGPLFVFADKSPNKRHNNRIVGYCS